MALDATNTNVLGTGGANTFKKELTKEYWEKKFMLELEDNLVLYNLCSHSVIPKNTGDTIEWRMYKNFPINTDTSKEGGLVPIGEIPNVAGQKLNVIKMKSTIQPYGDFCKITTKAMDYSIDEPLSIAIPLLGRQSALVFEKKIMQGMCAGSNVWYAGDKTSRATVTSNDKITVSDIMKIKATFKKRGVTGQIIGIISPEVELDLKLQTTANNIWTECAKYAKPEELYKGEIGKFLDIRWIVSNEINEVSNGASSAINLHQCIFMVQGAVDTVMLTGESNKPSLIIKKAKDNGTEDPFNVMNTVAWINKGFGTRIRRDEEVIRYECATGVTLPNALTDTTRNGYYAKASGF